MFEESNGIFLVFSVQSAYPMFLYRMATRMNTIHRDICERYPTVFTSMAYIDNMYIGCIWYLCLNPCFLSPDTHLYSGTSTVSLANTSWELQLTFFKSSIITDVFVVCTCVSLVKARVLSPHFLFGETMVEVCLIATFLKPHLAPSLFLARSAPEAMTC